MKETTIKVGMLARVEGEGALTLRFKDDELVDAKLRIFEPPRFFEAFLLGRRYDEAPDITARICGICPVAYQMSSATAMESALGVHVGGPLRELRRLIYCGEWIESHALHMHMLHAPDFLGYEDAIQMAADHPEPVTRGLHIKKVGNELMRLVGGREIHPINIRIGGFYSVPKKKALLAYRDEVQLALEESLEAARWVSTLEFPDFEPDTEFVAMRHPDEYPIFEGRIVSTKGLDLAIADYEKVFYEIHEEHSHALHGRKRDGGIYQVGPIARFNLNREKLGPVSSALAKELGYTGPVGNPFRSIVVRSIEMVYALEEALRIIDAYEAPDRPAEPVEVRAGSGCGCSEAPRGICYHRYDIDENGDIVFALIVPPTSQNQPRIEQDLMEFVPTQIGLPEDLLRKRCEQAVRNYDPCISCATHFLRLKIERD